MRPGPPPFYRASLEPQRRVHPTVSAFFLRDSMTDLSTVLPNFATAPFSHLLPSLDRSLITTSDLLTLNAIDIARRAHVPPSEVAKLNRAVLVALQAELALQNDSLAGSSDSDNGERQSETGITRRCDWNAISTLDDVLDAALGAGIPSSFLTEVTGERYLSPGTQPCFRAYECS